MLGSLHATACYYPECTPDEIHIYRVIEEDRLFYAMMEYDRMCYGESKITDYSLNNEWRNTERNISLWQKQTSASIDSDDIFDVVYDYGLGTTQKRLTGKLPPKNQNSFEKWIRDNRRHDIIDLLLTAKRCAELRRDIIDPWYYRRDDDSHTAALDSIASKCMRAASGPMADRYTLQAVRALVAARRYDDCLNFWQQAGKRMAPGVMRDMTEREVAAAMLRVGLNDEAARIYIRQNDIRSLVQCRRFADDRERMLFVYDVCPDSPYLKEEVQRYLLQIDVTSQWYSDDSITKRNINALTTLARRAINERRSTDMALWHYVMGAALDADGRTTEALKYIRRGEGLCRDPFMKNSLRVLRIYAEAKTARPGQTYDRRLLRDLRWLDGMIRRNLDTATVNILSEERSYKWRCNFYYWNAAMRRIVLDVMVPRTLAAGDTMRALQLANMAENRLLMLAGISRTQKNYDGSTFNPHDYSNRFFCTADSLPASTLARYGQRMRDNGRSALDRFLNSRSYRDRDYWNDIIGTAYLREMDYTHAVRYLCRVSPEFQKRLNTAEYMLYDPFDYRMWQPARIKDNSNYKLRFARRMLALEHRMHHARSCNERATALIEYAVGLRNSAGRFCWPLTRYYDTSIYRYSQGYFSNEIQYGKTFICDNNGNSSEYPLSETQRKRIEVIENTSKQLIARALRMITAPEMAARQMHLLAMNKQVMDSYPKTATARYLRAHCDAWRDYRP